MHALRTLEMGIKSLFSLCLSLGAWETVTGGLRVPGRTGCLFPACIITCSPARICPPSQADTACLLPEKSTGVLSYVWSGVWHYLEGDG